MLVDERRSFESLRTQMIYRVVSSRRFIRRRSMVSFSARIDKRPAATSTSGNNAELPSRMVEAAGDNVTWDLEARETIAYSTVATILANVLH